jgi:hypothetical protein
MFTVTLGIFVKGKWHERIQALLICLFLDYAVFFFATHC